MKTLVISVLALILVNSVAQIYAQSGWFPLNSGTQQYMNCILFVNENTGYVGADGGADGGEVLITTNSGVNWTISFTGNINSWPYEMFFFNALTGYIASLDGGVYKTINGGLNLQHISGGSPCSIFFSSADTGYYSTKYFGVYKTTNGGYNWFNIKLFSNPWDINQGIHFFNNNTGYIGGGELYKTTNGGISWDSINIANDLYISDMQFLNNSTGYLCSPGNTRGVFKTTNSGNNWTSVYINNGIEDIHFINENTGFGTIYYNLFIKTTDGGINWSEYSDTSFATPTGIYFTNALTGYMITRWGKILKTTNGGVTIGIHQISTEIPEKFSLSQNYPNPFNPETNIKFAVPKPSMVKIIIYDLLGKEIEILVNENLSAGTYKVDWNASACPSGIYFYVISAGEFTQTKKMVLVK